MVLLGALCLLLPAVPRASCSSEKFRRYKGREQGRGEGFISGCPSVYCVGRLSCGGKGDVEGEEEKGFSLFLFKNLFIYLFFIFIFIFRILLF